MDYKLLLKTGCEELGVFLDEDRLERFMKYKEILLIWNKKMNLTAITDERDIIIKHFIDSISASKGIDIKDNDTVIDVGTGAGFPGLPLKIAFPEIKLTLLDSLNKRIIFLNEVIECLGLKDVKCVHARAEDGGRDVSLREKYDLCFSRAVANLSVLSEYCLPFVKVGGSFVSLKGPDFEEELNMGKGAIATLGGIVDSVNLVNIPKSDITHSIIVIKKTGNTPKKYPRKAGFVNKNPI